MIKVVSVNEKSGKVELTVEQLEQMLNEAYQAGKMENNITAPNTGKSWWDNPYRPSWMYEDTTTTGPNEHMNITYCNNATTTEGVAK